MAHEYLTAGAADFAKWMSRYPNQTVAAALVGMNQQRASKIAIGRFVPKDFETIELMRKVCGILPRRWTILTAIPVSPKRPRGKSRRTTRSAA